MKEQSIDEVRQCLIKKHGENISKPMGRYTYKNVNLYLNSFDNFIKSLDTISQIYEINLEDEAYKLICEYCKTCEYNELDEIIAKFNHYIAKFNKDGCVDYNFLYKFKHICADLNKDAIKIKIDRNDVSRIFKYYLGIANERKRRGNKYNYTSNQFDNHLSDVTEYMINN